MAAPYVSIRQAEAADAERILETGDGAVDRVLRRSPKPVASIYIHAGAGYHSFTNEKVHLGVCAQAARAGMKLLKAGGSATQAVETAIRCLEDKEITNAGFGSNLNLDGVVECDATVVDHLGRSGACGAVPGIKNPITLAKLILDTSTQPLSLHRVPPNLLVGRGATLFAEEHGIPATSNCSLVSKNALDRYVRWLKDLKKAEGKSSKHTGKCSKEPESQSPSPDDYEAAADPATTAERRDHTSAILTGTWNEGQPDSPGPQESSPGISTSSMQIPNDVADVTEPFTSRLGNSAAKRPKLRTSFSEEILSTPGFINPSATAASPHDGGRSVDETAAEEQDRVPMQSYRAGFDSMEQGRSTSTYAGVKRPASDIDLDLISDTIGAIAVDMEGRIAAGSSSGGIGMKHRGRVGPAALVGVGTAVIPVDPEDDEQVTVAAVTSGTGEHMATSNASLKCAERLLTNTRRGPGNRNLEVIDERLIMEAFITDDFMGHPGVREQPSPGAIGVMAVKKDRTGVAFHFAHNTDSFALATMASTDRDPLCVMSRRGENGFVAQGARKIRTPRPRD